MYRWHSMQNAISQSWLIFLYLYMHDHAEFDVFVIVLVQLIFNSKYVLGDTYCNSVPDYVF